MGIKDQKAICDFGADFILEQINALNKQIDGALIGEDIEFIHQLRVASRRLRNGLALFNSCLPKKKGKTWQDQIRKVTKSLGKARDLDIQIDLISQLNLMTMDESFTPGYDRLLLRLSQQREKAQASVNKALEQLRQSQVLDKMADHLAELVSENKTIGRYAPALYQKAYDAIHSRLADFLDFEQYIDDEENIEKLHAMRIAGKHLRYTLEIFAPIYDTNLLPHIRAMKEVQDLLGVLHDNDVWIEWLPRFIQQEKERITEFHGHAASMEMLLPGLHHLIEDRKQSRARDYQMFLQIWETLNYEQAWDVLNQIIRDPIQHGMMVKAQTQSEPSYATQNDPAQGSTQEFQVELTEEDIDYEVQDPEDQPPDNPW